MGWVTGCRVRWQSRCWHELWASTLTHATPNLQHALVLGLQMVLLWTSLLVL